MQSEAIVVYSGPRCMQCRSTKNELTRLGLQFTEVDVTTDETANAYVASLGYRQVPVVVLSNGDHWSGFQPDRLKAIKVE